MAQDIIKGLITFDSEHQHGLYPYTSTDCIFDEDGTPLENLINNQTEVLWTNPNASVAFASGTTQVDLADYDLYQVIMKGVSDQNIYTSQIMTKGIGYQFVMPWNSTGGTRIFQREITLNNDDFTVGGGSEVIINTGGSVSYRADNTRLIPYQIRGFKVKKITKTETSMDVAYTNPNPSSSFPLTTINLDLSGTPKMLMFECRIYASSATVYKQCMTVPFVDGFYVMTAPRFDGSSNQIMGRSFRIQGNQVVAQTGYSMGSYGSMGTTNNNAMIPLNIYAIY